MLDFKLKNSGTMVSLIPVLKDTDTVIKPGKMIKYDGSILAIEAAYESTTGIAYAPFGAIKGETTVLVVKEADAVFVGTANRLFEITTDVSRVCDIADLGSEQGINLDTNGHALFRTATESNGAKEGSDLNVEVVINSPLHFPL